MAIDLLLAFHSHGSEQIMILIQSARTRTAWTSLRRVGQTLTAGSTKSQFRKRRRGAAGRKDLRLCPTSPCLHVIGWHYELNAQKLRQKLAIQLHVLKSVRSNEFVSICQFVNLPIFRFLNHATFSLFFVPLSVVLKKLVDHTDGCMTWVLELWCLRPKRGFEWVWTKHQLIAARRIFFLESSTVNYRTQFYPELAVLEDIYS